MWNPAPPESPREFSLIRSSKYQLHWRDLLLKTFFVSLHVKYDAGIDSQLALHSVFDSCSNNICADHRTSGNCALSSMLTVSQLSKSFAGRALFDDVSLQVNRGNRIGLVGPNGAGKSTLFALLLGEISPDKGTIAIEKNATIGFLPQETAAAGDETVLELALAVSPELVRAQKVIKQR